MKLIRWLFRRSFQAEYDAGYRSAVDRILLLPEKVRLGNTLELDTSPERPVTILNCSFVGGDPAISLRGEVHTRGIDLMGDAGAISEDQTP